MHTLQHTAVREEFKCLRQQPKIECKSTKVNQAHNTATYNITPLTRQIPFITRNHLLKTQIIRRLCIYPIRLIRDHQSRFNCRSGRYGPTAPTKSLIFDNCRVS